MSVEAAPTQHRHPRLHGMDGFRALAALAIVAFHTYLATSWATVGSATGSGFVQSMPPLVDGAFRNLTLRTNVFFVLSGLLLGLPFVRWALLRHAPRPGIRRFARRRFARIWPLYLPLMLLSAATVAIGRTSVEQVVVNALMLQHVVPGGTHLLPPTWTLSVELGFYALLPLTMLAVVPAARRLPTLGLRAALVGSVAVAWIIVGCLARRAGELVVGGASLRATTAGHLDNFAAGLLAATVLTAALAGRGRLAERVRHLPAGAWTAAGTALVALGLHARWQSVDGRVAAAWWWVAPVALGVACWMLAVALRPDRSLLARVVGAPVLLWVGKVSYGLFLWHYIVLHWFSVAGVTRAGGLEAVGLNLAMVLAATLPLAWLSWHVVELPVLDGRVRLPRPSLPSRSLLQLAPARPAPDVLPTPAARPAPDLRHQRAATHSRRVPTAPR